MSASPAPPPLPPPAQYDEYLQLKGEELQETSERLPAAPPSLLPALCALGLQVGARGR